MAGVYSAISAILLFWHAAWDLVLGAGTALGTSWTWVLGIVFLVLTVRLALFPVVIRQVQSQRAMQALQPRLKALQAQHKDDPQAMQRELMALYQAEKINPLASLLPMLVQIPVFLGLFHVLRHLRPSITSESARTLYGWTLTQFDSAANAKLFGAPLAATFHTSGATVQLVAALLIAVMVVTTYLSSRQMILKTGWAEDPQQKMIQRLMLYGIPASLLVSGLLFPIGVIVYWVTQNLFALGQQTWILHKYPMPVTGPAALPVPSGGPDAGSDRPAGR
nr:membrane protein insertase YidC [Actinoplanes lichenis]